jgi:hypothetical protein
MLGYPRQQQYLRLARAVVASTLSAVAALLALLALLAAAAGGVLPIAALMFLVAVGFGLNARRWARLAARARVGARSEDQVQRALAPLGAEGWRLRHSVPWRGRGDVDSIALAPTGFAFAIETKTRTYTPEHLARVHETAGWLNTRRYRWCPNGALPVLCIVRAPGLERVEEGVLVVSLERLPAALRTAARTRGRPAFLVAPPRAIGAPRSRGPSAMRIQARRPTRRDGFSSESRGLLLAIRYMGHVAISEPFCLKPATRPASIFSAGARASTTLKPTLKKLRCCIEVSETLMRKPGSSDVTTTVRRNAALRPIPSARLASAAPSCRRWTDS